MAYIGKEPADSFISFAKQDFTTSATTSYTLDNAVTNENELALFINFVRQEPTTAYTASGTSLTLTSATASTDDMYCVYLGQAKQTVNAPDGSVGTSQLASTSVTAAKLNNDIISGTTALASEPADTDEFLVSDAGTLKRIDYSLIKGGGITVASQFRLTSDFATGGAYITSNWEASDTAPQANLGSVTESSGVFSLPSTGFYKVEFSAMFRGNGDGDVRKAYAEIYATTDNSSYNAMALGSNGLNNHGLDYDFSSHASCILDITDTSNYKLKFYVSNSVGTGIVTRGSTSNSLTYVNIIRLGDT